ncbi:hypothetical protein DIPPA_25284 [Diplonema papillatum]|nr:hypothetical protein DIPPA_25284 [Diplonema papillatum]
MHTGSAPANSTKRPSNAGRWSVEATCTPVYSQDPAPDGGASWLNPPSPSELRCVLMMSVVFIPDADEEAVDTTVNNSATETITRSDDIPATATATRSVEAPPDLSRALLRGFVVVRRAAAGAPAPLAATRSALPVYEVDEAAAAQLFWVATTLGEQLESATATATATATTPVSEGERDDLTASATVTALPPEGSEGPPVAEPPNSTEPEAPASAVHHVHLFLAVDLGGFDAAAFVSDVESRLPAPEGSVQVVSVAAGSVVVVFYFAEDPLGARARAFVEAVSDPSHPLAAALPAVLSAAVLVDELPADGGGGALGVAQVVALSLSGAAAAVAVAAAAGYCARARRRRLHGKDDPGGDTGGQPAPASSSSDGRMDGAVVYPQSAPGSPAAVPRLASDRRRKAWRTLGLDARAEHKLETVSHRAERTGL